MSTYTAKITGISPLLQNNPAGILFAPKGKTRAQSDRPPHEQAENAVYKDGELFVHPVSGFRNAFISAAKKYKIGRSYASSSLAGALTVSPDDYAVICDHSGEPVTEYEVDVRTVVMPSTKGRVVRGRPKFTEWGTVLRLEIDDRYWPGDDALLEEILECAGNMIGVGDGRPEKKGLQFGKFTVELTKE